MKTDELINNVQQKGYCLIENVIPEDDCSRIKESITETVSKHRVPTAPKNVGFVNSVINHDQSFVPYLTEPRLMAVAEAMLGENFRISFTSAIVNELGNDRGTWHADWPHNQNNAGHVVAPYPDATLHLTTLWLISPFTKENGGTLVVPGSHRRSTNPTEAGHEQNAREPAPGEINVEGAVGGVFLFDSRLWHSTAKNHTDERRVALAVRYAPWWLNLEVLRPESADRECLLARTGKNENAVPSIKRELYDRLPTEVQVLYRHWIEDLKFRK